MSTRCASTPSASGRLLNNLIGNALRHTPPGGQVEISARREAGSAVRSEVRDTGEGIRPEDLPHVFDRFYRGEKAAAGPPAAPGWAWRLPAGSSRRMAAGSGRKRAGKRGRILFHVVIDIHTRVW